MAHLAKPYGLESQAVVAANSRRPATARRRQNTATLGRLVPDAVDVFEPAPPSIATNQVTEALALRSLGFVADRRSRGRT